MLYFWLPISIHCILLKNIHSQSIQTSKNLWWNTLIRDGMDRRDLRKDDDGFWAIRGKRNIPEETRMLKEETYGNIIENQDIDEYSEFSQEDLDKLHKEFLDIINSLLQDYPDEDPVALLERAFETDAIEEPEKRGMKPYALLEAVNGKQAFVKPNGLFSSIKGKRKMKPNGLFGAVGKRTMKPNGLFGAMGKRLMKPNGLFGSLGKRSMKPNGLFGSLGKRSMKPNGLFGSLGKRSMKPNGLFGSLGKRSMKPNGLFGSLGKRSMKPNGLFGSLGKRNIKPNGLFEALGKRFPQLSELYSLSLKGNFIKPNSLFNVQNKRGLKPNGMFSAMGGKRHWSPMKKTLKPNGLFYSLKRSDDDLFDHEYYEILGFEEPNYEEDEDENQVDHEVEDEIEHEVEDEDEDKNDEETENDNGYDPMPVKKAEDPNFWAVRGKKSEDDFWAVCGKRSEEDPDFFAVRGKKDTESSRGSDLKSIDANEMQGQGLNTDH